MESIRTMKTDVSDVVARSVTNTFGVMFRREVAPEGAGKGFAEGTGQDICSTVSLWQEGRLNVDFCFVFNRDLLSAIVGEAYPSEPQDNRALLCQDIACAVANIVVSNVKTYLNGRGFDMTMNFPEAGKAAANGSGDQVEHLKFSCDRHAGVLVNMKMKDPTGPKAG